jgi:hypothetical protein
MLSLENILEVPPFVIETETSKGVSVVVTVIPFVVDEFVTPFTTHLCRPAVYAVENVIVVGTLTPDAAVTIEELVAVIILGFMSVKYTGSLVVISE